MKIKQKNWSRFEPKDTPKFKVSFEEFIWQFFILMLSRRNSS